jgi:hypothetical protein
MIYIDIDPGKNGGLAILQGEEVQTFRYDRDTYRCVLSDLRGEKAVCCLEHVSAMPGQGVTSMFHLGEGFGWIQGTLEAFGVPYELVRPQKRKQKTFSASPLPKLNGIARWAIRKRSRKRKRRWTSRFRRRRLTFGRAQTKQNLPTARCVDRSLTNGLRIAINADRRLIGRDDNGGD